jgi:hypothetical protein
MAYKIPKNLTKYSELFIWGLSFKQFGYASAMALALFFVFAKMPTVPMYLKIIMTVPIVLIGFLFMYGKVDEKWVSKQNLKKSLRNTGYYDSKIDSFISIKEINDDTVFLKSGKMLAILKTNPIDFAILGKEQQEYVMNTYRNWLRSLDYEVQVTCRSIDLNMTNWLQNLGKKEYAKRDPKRHNSFKKWISEFVEKRNVRNRVFYIILPLTMSIQSNKSFFKSIGDWLKGKSISGLDKDDPAYKKALGALNDRVQNCMESLKPCGVKMKKLDNNELLGLYSSYFTNVPGGGRSYLTPAMWLERSDEIKQNKICGIKNGN